MSGLRGEVLDWFVAGRVTRGREGEALRAAGLVPAASQWRAFLSQLTLWLGAVALAASVIFFIAYNWDDLGRFAKFGLVEALILVGLLACWRLGLDSMAGKAVLLLLSLLVGALLALAGQVYQTGADTYELFAYWAALILPWVLLGRFSPLWLLWLALLNLAIQLYFQRSWAGEPMIWALFALNTAALGAWEAAHRSGISWLRESWPPRLVAIFSAMSATALAIWAIVSDRGSSGLLAALAYFAWLGAFYVWYRHFRTDLFMLAAGLLSLIITVAAFLSKQILGNEGGAYLFIGVVVIGMSGAGALWLKSVAREQFE